MFVPNYGLTTDDEVIRILGRELVENRMNKLMCVFTTSDGKFSIEGEQLVSQIISQKCLRVRPCFPAATGSMEYAAQNIEDRYAKFFDSVGYVKYKSIHSNRSITGTSFLVSERIIVTNYHVAADILKAKNKTSFNSYHDDTYVYFDYKYRGQESFLSNGYKLKPFSYESIGLEGSEECDYVFLHLEKPPKKLTLGQFVRYKAPECGNVLIVGHPNGDVKQYEECPLLFSQDIERRYTEEKQHSGHDPSFHKAGDEIRNLFANNFRLSYDAKNMIEGSSGSPVFDMDGSIVTLHTLGYRYGTHVHMKAAIKFQCVIDDLLRRNRCEFVNDVFPQHQCEKMEIDDDDDEMEVDYL